MTRNRFSVRKDGQIGLSQESRTAEGRVARGVVVAIAIACTTWAAAQTSGDALLQATLLDYNGSGTRHYTVVWVTSEAGAFIKTLRKQGPSNWASREWSDHCGTWNTARAGSTVLDGYSSATAQNYSATNSPVILTWDGRDASGLVLPDGNYKFWVQYAENSGQGPYTASGLAWTKGPTPSTTTYPNQGANFADMRVTWTPDIPVGIAPTITSLAPPATGFVGVPYLYTSTAAGTAPITFSASGLPPGLTMSAGGQISGTPAQPGTFSGSIVAANGTPPDDTQGFSIVISEPLVTITAFSVNDTQLVMNGHGPANTTWTLLAAEALDQSPAQWASLSSVSIGAEGTFQISQTRDTGVPRRYYLLRLEP